MKGKVFMNNSFNKKIAEMLGKMDDKMFKAKLNGALEMLKDGNSEELAKKINKIDREELLGKISEFDSARLDEMKIDRDTLKKQVDETDLNKLQDLLGDNGDEIIKKLRDMLG